MEGMVEPGKEISFVEKVEFVKSICNLGDRLNAVVTQRMRIGWLKFRECGELLYGRKLK